MFYNISNRFFKRSWFCATDLIDGMTEILLEYKDCIYEHELFSTIFLKMKCKKIGENKITDVHESGQCRLEGIFPV